MPNPHRARPEFQDTLEEWIKDSANREVLRNAGVEVRVVLEMLVETAGAPKPANQQEWFEILCGMLVHGRAFEDETPVV